MSDYNKARGSCHSELTQIGLNFNGNNTPNLLPFIRYKKKLKEQAEEIYKQRIAEANRGGLFEFYSE
ncbi:MAG: hypothetical protein NZ811_08880 [Gammaproteobacteria bacterium]|nr:hypothetical protein [Gammaproteobacteria bacterium]